MEALVRLLADASLLVIVLAGLTACLLTWIRQPNKSRWLNDTLPLVVMAGLTSLLLAKFASLWYQPSSMRPFVERGLAAGAAYIDNPGFPSDHALLATVVVAAVWAVTPYRKTALVLALLVVIMSAARVVALVHTPLDVLGGVVFGLLGVWWYGRRRIIGKNA